jgi:hypothetical protein
MLCERRLEGGCNGVRQSGNAQSHARSKDKDRGVAGRTKESRKTFLKQAKGILSAQQFAQLKAQCQKSAKETKKTQA